MIFVEEGTEDYLNVTCGQQKGKLSSKYGKFLVTFTFEYLHFLVNSGEDSIVSVEFPMHESAKRGNLEFVRECLKNKVITLLVTISYQLEFLDLTQQS